MHCILQQTWRHTWTALATSSSMTPVPMSSIIQGVLQQCMVCMHQVMMELRVVWDINPTLVQDNALCAHPLIGAEFPIGFMLKSFSDMEWNYQIHNKEMLAIMHALEEWRHFLEGS